MECTAFLRNPLVRFEQQVGAVAQVCAGEALTPEQFRLALTALRTALNELGRDSVLGLVARAEEHSDTLERGTVYRCKEVSPKEWFTPWGKISVPRRLYQADRGGACVVPVDQRCGMVDRFMVPMVERVCCLLGAQLVPAEVEQALAEILGEGPSCTAIQQVVREVGQHAEQYAVECEVAVQAEQPLAPGGNALVAGWDGTMVPLRQAGPKPGRPSRCPAHTATTEGQATTWKEAGVGMVAVYELPSDPEQEEARRRDVRYFARTPEPKMVHLVDAVAAQVEAALAQGHFDYHLFMADAAPRSGGSSAPTPCSAPSPSCSTSSMPPSICRWSARRSSTPVVRPPNAISTPGGTACDTTSTASPTCCARCDATPPNAGIPRSSCAS